MAELQHAVTDLEDRLREAARERWGDGWTIEVRHFADGTTRMHAYSNQGQTADGNTVRERLMPGSDGELHHEKVVVSGGEEIVEQETLESPAR